MANSDRLFKDKNGNMFIPMNVEGGSWNEHFMTTPKLVALGLSVFSFIVMIAWLKGRYVKTSSYVIFIALWVACFQFVLRYIIFEEKFYYRMYKNLKQSEITTPSIFWDIASIKDTEDGAILTYADGKLGVIVKLERGTITGRPVDFEEEHYDAISDFYKDITRRKYSFVQANIMERAGNDPRLVELDKLTTKSDNPNICKLMDIQIGYTKTITNSTLYESDYILVYINEMSRIDYIVNDVIESVYTILDGAYIGYRILELKDITEIIKEEYGVKFFDYTEATLSMFKNHGVITKKPFELSEVIFTDGQVQKLGNRELNIINMITSEVSKGTIDINKVSIKDAILSKDSKEEFNGIDFDTLGESIGSSGVQVPKNEKNVKKENKREDKKSCKEEGVREEFSGEFEFNEFDKHEDNTFIDF